MKRTKNDIRTDQFTINLVRNMIERIPIVEEGTCNPQDPTAYSKGEITFGGTAPWKYRIEITNFWGTQINIYQVAVGKYPKEALVADLYLELYGYSKYELYVWKRFKGMWKLISLLNKIHEPIKHPEDDPDYEYFEDPMGCLADYE